MAPLVHWPKSSRRLVDQLGADIAPWPAGKKRGFCPLRQSFDARPKLQVVGLGGVEPPTSPLSGVRSNQLSYRPARLTIQGHASDLPDGGHQLNIGIGNL